MSDLDPIALDRQLARAHEDVRDWQARLRDEPEFFDDPFEFHRRILGKSHFDELWETAESDPLRLPLLRWTYCLGEERVNHWWTTHTSQLRYRTEYGLETPIRGKSTLHAMLEKVIAGGDAQTEYWKALQQHAKPCSEALAILWARKQEIRDRFGHERLAQLIEPEVFITELAHTALASAPLSELKRTSLLDWMNQGAATAAAGAMPGRLTEASVADWFRDGRLLEDLPLGSWALPSPLLPATFLRVMDELGRRFRTAAGPTHQPFVIANDPHQLEGHALGYCFLSLLLNPAFVERHLGLDRKHQTDYMRAMARSVLLDWMGRGLKVLLRAPALTSSAQLRLEFQERIAEYCGAEPNPNLALVLFRLRNDDPQRFLGAALGMKMASELREQHDEDWYRNPRAIDQMRSLARISPRLRVEREEADSALVCLQGFLEPLLH
jgi:hypothetical protein